MSLQINLLYLGQKVLVFYIFENENLALPNAFLQ